MHWHSARREIKQIKALTFIYWFIILYTLQYPTLYLKSNSITATVRFMNYIYRLYFYGIWNENFMVPNNDIYHDFNNWK